MDKYYDGENLQTEGNERLDESFQTVDPTEQRSSDIDLFKDMTRLEQRVAAHMDKYNKK